MMVTHAGIKSTVVGFRASISHLQYTAGATNATGFETPSGEDDDMAQHRVPRRYIGWG